MPCGVEMFVHPVGRFSQSREKPNGPGLADKVLIRSAFPLPMKIVVQPITTVFPINNLGIPEGQDVFAENPFKLLFALKQSLLSRPIPDRRGELLCCLIGG